MSVEQGSSNLKILIAIILLLLTTTASAERLRGTDLHVEFAWTALHVIDWAQTRRIANEPENFVEKNPILGEHPSIGRVNAYMGLTLGLHWLIATKLPPVPRRIFQIFTIGVTAEAVHNNVQVGIHMDF